MATVDNAFDRRVRDHDRLVVIETNYATLQRRVHTIEDRLWLIVIGSLGGFGVATLNFALHYFETARTVGVILGRH